MSLYLEQKMQQQENHLCNFQTRAWYFRFHSFIFIVTLVEKN